MLAGGLCGWVVWMWRVLWAYNARGTTRTQHPRRTSAPSPVTECPCADPDTVPLLAVRSDTKPQHDSPCAASASAVATCSWKYASICSGVEGGVSSSSSTRASVSSCHIVSCVQVAQQPTYTRVADLLLLGSGIGGLLDLLVLLAWEAISYGRRRRRRRLARCARHDSRKPLRNSGLLRRM